MEYLSSEACSTSQGKILCCECGTLIEPNPANMCVACLRTKVDITDGIPKQSTLHFCRGCERYLNPPAQWVHCSLESRELLALCLKKLKGLNKVRLIDACFVWTEPHSKRIKMKLTIQKEVLSGTVLQQVFVVEFVVNHQMCETCHRREAKDFWRALVQVRQKTEHKKTFFYLEQLILKHNAHVNCLNIKYCHGGLDFFFAKRDDASKIVDFFQTVVPCRYLTSQQLISHDVHSNVYNYKHTFSVEIAPICKDDVVCLPPALARSLGNIGQIAICYRITNAIHLIDPSTLQVAEVNSNIYWRSPFQSLCSLKRLTEYSVMDIEVIMDVDQQSFSGQGPKSAKHVLSDVWVVRTKDLGSSSDQIHCRTHLGYVLKPGDTVLGFDVANANINDVNFDKMKADRVPDVILVKKIYENKLKRVQNRRWKLKRLNVEMESDSQSLNRDYMDFLEDLEEDQAYRQNVNIHIDREKMPVDADDTEDEDVPRISLQEMLEDLTLAPDDLESNVY